MRYNFNLGSLLKSLRPPPKKKIFVSYHHGEDQYYYNIFSKTFADVYDVIHGNSLDRLTDNDNVDYRMQCIHDECISCSYCTIVLCGAQTPGYKCVDWEIKATLDNSHGLIGVNLPTNPLNLQGKYTIPDRLHYNIQSGYAIWANWNNIVRDVRNLNGLIEMAIRTPRSYIENDRLSRYEMKLPLIRQL